MLSSPDTADARGRRLDDIRPAPPRDGRRRFSMRDYPLLPAFYMVCLLGVRARVFHVGARLATGGHCLLATGWPLYRLGHLAVRRAHPRLSTRSPWDRRCEPCTSGSRAPRMLESFEPTGARRDSERSIPSLISSFHAELPGLRNKSRRRSLPLRRWIRPTRSTEIRSN